MENVETLVKTHDFTVEQTVKEFKLIVILIDLKILARAISCAES
jgi:hypothetical protein